MADRIERRLCAIMQASLCKDRRDVILDGTFSERQRFRDLAIAGTAPQQPHDGELSFAQIPCWQRRGRRLCSDCGMCSETTENLSRHTWLQWRISPTGRPDRVRKRIRSNIL